MPVIYPQIRNIDLSEAQRYAGLQQAADWQSSLWTQVCQELLILAKPQATYQIYEYCSTSGMIIAPKCYQPNSAGLKRHLQDAKSLVVLAATVGGKVDEYIESLFKQDNYARGLCANAAATALIEQVADYAGRLLEKTAYFKQGRYLGKRFSPGYGDWQLTAQRDLAQLIDLSEIGLNLTESCFLQPKKSITAVIPIFTAGKASLAGCKTCVQQNCAYRKLS